MAIQLQIPAQLLLKAQQTRVAFFDVDGVLTDGGIWLSSDGQEATKRFNILDGLGLKLLMKGGITPVIITGRDSAALRARVQALGIERAFFGVQNKLPVAEAVLRELELEWAQAAAIGDDWPDLPVMLRAGFSSAPANAHIEVKARADFITTALGGHGAAREFCDLLLVASGRYAGLLDEACNK